jgi:hypothetical protein
MCDLPVEYQNEIMAHLGHIRGWGAKFLGRIPEMSVI